MSLLDDLISYWKLDEASGNALDAHGSNELADTNTVGSGTGKISNARDFESGSGEYFTRASNSSLQTGNIDFTIQAWVNLESVGANRQVVTKFGASGNFEYALIYNHTDQRFTLFVTSDGTGGTIVAVNANNLGAPSTGVWYHILCWHDSVANQIGIAVNNGTPNTTSHSAGVHVGTAAFQIGNRETTTEYFDGLIDEVAFWKRMLTSDERTSLYNGGAGLAYPLSVGGHAHRKIGGPRLFSKIGGGLAA